MCGGTCHGACVAVYFLKLCEGKRKNYADRQKCVKIKLEIF